MDRLVLAILPLAFVLGCKDYKPEMERALIERDSVILMSEAKENSINEFIETLNQIEVNLDSITQSQHAIALASDDKVEFNKDIRERINQNIVIINELLEKNKQMIDELGTKLKNANFNTASLKKMIEKLKSDISGKDAELAMLNDEITTLKGDILTLNYSVDSLNIVNTQKEVVIDEKITQLNTAYWTIGTYKELKKANILDKQGGFLGLGKENVLKQDFNNNPFNQLDITKVTIIEVNSKSVSIITSHSSDSFKLNKDEKGVTKTLEITNPTRFWKASKYLVIVTG